uniref:Uncharacterized protein n=1 Tax=Nannospalax galili TaxID=1026970 RepID=A0A8C6QVL9_NANGA
MEKLEGYLGEAQSLCQAVMGSVQALECKYSKVYQQKDIEFLKKETGHCRVLEEKEEIDKFLDKISELEGNLQTLMNSNST